VALALPAGTDGTWGLLLDLLDGGRALTGTALLTLSNQAAYPLVLQGRASGSTALLSLTGEPLAAVGEGLGMRATVMTLEGGQAWLSAFSCRAYGQTVVW